MTSYRCALALCGIFALLISVTFADIVQFKPCTYSEDHGPSKCIVHEVRVDPCKEAAQGKACRLKRGRNATIEFDYTASFTGDTLESNAYWVNNIIEMPFIGMEHNACLSTPCPIVTGQKQNYRMELPIAKSYPLRSYDVKWQVQNPEGEDCCFIFQIRIHK